MQFRRWQGLFVIEHMLLLLPMSFTHRLPELKVKSTFLINANFALIKRTVAM